MPTFQSPAKANFADNSPSRERETSADAVVATVSVSVDVDYDNDAALPRPSRPRWRGESTAGGIVFAGDTRRRRVACLGRRQGAMAPVELLAQPP
jgi:hypothetical protein